MSSIIFNDGKTAIAAGLSWTVLTSEIDSKKHNAAESKAIAKKAKAINATLHKTLVAQNSRFLGLYSPPALLDKKLPRVIHSLGVIFLEHFSAADRNELNAILTITLAAGTRAALIIIESGQIVVDVVDESLAIRSRIASSVDHGKSAGLPYQVYSNQDTDISQYQANSVSFESLIPSANKQNALVAIPRNNLLLAIVFFLILGISIGLYYYFAIHAVEVEKKRIAAAKAAENQTPKYMALLNSESQKIGWNKESLQTHLNGLTKLNAFVEGWSLESISCDISNPNCTFIYQRQGGQINNLISREKNKVYDPKNSTVDKAVFFVPQNIPVQSLSPSDFGDLEILGLSLKNLQQRLLTSGGSVTRKEPVIWPLGNYDINKVNKSSYHYQIVFETTTKFQLLKSVFDEFPKDMQIRAYDLRLSYLNNSADTLLINLKGANYAKNKL